MFEKKQSSIDYARKLAEAEARALKILELQTGATKERIKEAYWLKAMEFHPDKNYGNLRAAANFKAVTWAYNFLTGKDREIRRVHWEVPHDDTDPARSGKYHTDNSWGHFLWWREKFF